MPAPEVTQLPSIQGEGYQRPEPEPLSAQEIDAYVDNHSQGVVDCRAKRSHDYPSPRGVAEFDDYDEATGNLIAHYTCARCGCAVRREVWTAERTGRKWRYAFIAATTIYQKNTRGETYLLPPGSGRSKPSQYRESLMTKAMTGQSPAAIRKQLRRTTR
jgi:hypothetical protein